MKIQDQILVPLVIAALIVDALIFRDMDIMRHQMNRDISTVNANCQDVDKKLEDFFKVWNASVSNQTVTWQNQQQFDSNVLVMIAARTGSIPVYITNMLTGGFQAGIYRYPDGHFFILPTPVVQTTQTNQ